MAQAPAMPRIIGISRFSSADKSASHVKAANTALNIITIVGVEGFEPPKSTTPDLQSGADRHLCSTPEHQLPKKFDVCRYLVAHRPPCRHISTSALLKITDSLR